MAYYFHSIIIKFNGSGYFKAIITSDTIINFNFTIIVIIITTTLHTIGIIISYKPDTD